LVLSVEILLHFEVILDKTKGSFVVKKSGGEKPEEKKHVHRYSTTGETKKVKKWGQDRTRVYTVCSCNKTSSFIGGAWRGK